MTTRKRQARVVLPVLALFLVVTAACSDDGGDTATENPTSTASTAPPETPPTTEALAKTACTDTVPPADPDRPTFDAPPAMTIDMTKTYTATIETSCGNIVVALDAASAPIGVNNFVTLARSGFYDGLTFHRVVPDFVIQGGDPDGTGGGGPGYSVQTEAPPDGAYAIGDLAWAKTADDPDGTAGSQFFVITGSNGATLPPQYGYFGTVSEGLDVARTLESFAPAEGDGAPTRQLYINKVTITEGDAAASTTSQPG